MLTFKPLVRGKLHYRARKRCPSNEPITSLNPLKTFLFFKNLKNVRQYFPTPRLNKTATICYGRVLFVTKIKRQRVRVRMISSFEEFLFDQFHLTMLSLVKMLIDKVFDFFSRSMKIFNFRTSFFLTC